jgi:hypothetical protein
MSVRVNNYRTSKINYGSPKMPKSGTKSNMAQTFPDPMTSIFDSVIRNLNPNIEQHSEMNSIPNSRKIRSKGTQGSVHLPQRSSISQAASVSIDVNYLKPKDRVVYLRSHMSNNPAVDTFKYKVNISRYFRNTLCEQTPDPAYVNSISKAPSFVGGRPASASGTFITGDANDFIDYYDDIGLMTINERESPMPESPQSPDAPPSISYHSPQGRKLGEDMGTLYRSGGLRNMTIRSDGTEAPLSKLLARSNPTFHTFYSLLITMISWRIRLLREEATWGSSSLFEEHKYGKFSAWEGE